MSKMVSITAERLKDLERSEAFLNALQAAGVDNWEGCERAVQEMVEEDDSELWID
jgi:hypothetical protein